MDKMREEFEAWAVTSAWLGIGDESQMHQDADGTGYNEIEVHTAWLAWKASRATLVIELPYVHGYPANEAASDQDYYLDQAKADMRHQCKKAIEAAGPKVTP